jgi:hypothetical protein
LVVQPLALNLYPFSLCLDPHRFRNVAQRQKAATEWGNSLFSRIPPYGIL